MTNRLNPTRDFYDRKAESWAASKSNSFYHESEFRKFLAFLKKGDSVIDIGCANGIHVPLFLGIGQSKELQYEGLDVSKSFLEIARRRYPKQTFYEGDILDKDSLPQKKYDAFWAAAVLMHIPKEDWPEMMDAIGKLTNPGAVGYLTLPQERFADDDERHFTIFEGKELNELLTSKGWEVLDGGEKETTTSTAWLWMIVRLPA